jgi:YbbR domain-containing protein
VVDPVGDVGPDYKAYTDPEEIMLDREKVTITGPKVVVDQITQARIEVNLNNQTQTISENYRYTLCNDKNEPVDAAQIQVNAAEVNVTVKIQRIKVLELKVEIDTQGSNISEDVLHKVFSQKTIQVAGSEYALANLGDTLTLGKVTISEIINTSTFVFDMPELPEMVQNLTPTEQVTVTITFPGMSYTQWSVNAFTLINVPEGTAPKVGTTAILLTLFGPEEQIALLRQEDTVFEIEAVVDLANAVVDKPGNMTAQIRIVTPGFENVKILGNRDVYVEWEDAITAQ